MHSCNHSVYICNWQYSSLNTIESFALKNILYVSRNQSNLQPSSCHTLISASDDHRMMMYACLKVFGWLSSSTDKQEKSRSIWTKIQGIFLIGAMELIGYGQTSTSYHRCFSAVLLSIPFEGYEYFGSTGPLEILDSCPSVPNDAVKIEIWWVHPRRLT